VLAMAGRLLRKKEVLARIGVKHYSTLWRWSETGNFPKPVLLNPNCGNPPIAWREEDIEDWIASRPEGRGRESPMLQYRAKRAAAAARAQAPAPRALLLPPELRGQPGS
jgi:predicted DNA-binding transcriptional regulator AlpA